MEIITKLDNIIDHMNAGFTELRIDMAEVKTKVSNLDEKVSKLEGQVNRLNDQMRCVKTTIENEIWPGIKVIAEGHLDLSHKLDTYIAIAQEDKKYNAEVECLKLRMLELEKNAKLNS